VIFHISVHNLLKPGVEIRNLCQSKIRLIRNLCTGCFNGLQNILVLLILYLQESYIG
jgi:hypothetical protein